MWLFLSFNCFMNCKSLGECIYIYIFFILHKNTLKKCLVSATCVFVHTLLCYDEDTPVIVPKRCQPTSLGTRSGCEDHA